MSLIGPEPVILLDRLSPLVDHASVGEQGAATDVGGWLRRLGLEQYEASFRENKIDDTVLPRLTAKDLKDLGVGFVGHRRGLLDAIAGPKPGSHDDQAPATGERNQRLLPRARYVGHQAVIPQTVVKTPAAF